MDCIRNTVGVHTHRADGDLLAIKSKSFHHIGAERLFRFGTQAMNSTRRIVARESGQVDAGDGAQEPRRLPVLFHSAATC